MERARPAITAEDQRRWKALRAATPNTVPEGWTSPTTQPVRVNDYNKPGCFVRIYENGYLQLVFSMTAAGELQVTLLHLNKIVPTKEHTDLVLKSFFADRKATVKQSVLGQLVYFDLNG